MVKRVIERVVVNLGDQGAAIKTHDEYRYRDKDQQIVNKYSSEGAKLDKR